MSNHTIASQHFGPLVKARTLPILGKKKSSNWSPHHRCMIEFLSSRILKEEEERWRIFWSEVIIDSQQVWNSLSASDRSLQPMPLWGWASEGEQTAVVGAGELPESGASLPGIVAKVYRREKKTRKGIVSRILFNHKNSSRSIIINKPKRKKPIC